VSSKAGSAIRIKGSALEHVQAVYDSTGDVGIYRVMEKFQELQLL